MTKMLAAVILAGILVSNLAAWAGEPEGLSRDELVKAFVSPPRQSQAWCFWWWLNGNASKEGITRDMEEMKKQGINGALLFDAGQMYHAHAPRGPAFMSEAWRELFRHAVREADRCGIVLTVNLCSGWDCGGPWVTNEYAAKMLVAASTVVKGPGRVAVKLPQTVKGFYHDIAVWAAPIPKDAAPAHSLTASSQFKDFDPAQAEDGDDQTRWVSNGNKPGRGPTPQKPEFLQFNFTEPWAAAGVYIKPYQECGPKEIEVQCSDDGRTFRPLTRATLKPRKETTLAFEETRARQFRVLFLSSHPRSDGNCNVQVADIALLSKDQVSGKQIPAWLFWDRSRAVDVTRFVDQDGRLDWDVPAGNWKVLRIGCTLHGNMTKSVGSGPTGLEIDPMSAEAMDAHFAETGAKLIADAGPLAGNTLQYFHIDSWELGQPTWTPKMREEFQKRRGYDPLPWLPAVVGQTVDSAAATARFMQDYRRTAADLIAANYYGRLRELTLKGGLRGTHPESGGPNFTQWIDALQCEGINDVPMGEFWKRKSEPVGEIEQHHNPSLKQAASAMHIYGKRDCYAEAFTSPACDWIEGPWEMKDIGDAAFCEGLTRNVLHNWPTQLNPQERPGYCWAHIGTHFGYTLTWWPMADGWLTYLARCQHLLRQGLFVADIARLQSENIPGFIPARYRQIVPGYDYDAMNAEVLLNRASARDGRLVLPDGMSYRYLILPQQPGAILSPATLKKINELAEAGVAVIGSEPFAGSIPKMRKGNVGDIIQADGLAPDVEFRNSAKGANFDWIHRRNGDTEIYFLSNQSTLEATADVLFRVAGKQPELWDAVTGDVRDLTTCHEENGRTLVPMRFAPRQSWFVVFRKRIQNSESRIQNGGKNFPEIKPVMELTGPWDVQFDPQWFYPDNGTGGKVRFEKLADWTSRSEEAVKYYSGMAVYRKVFDWAGEPSIPATKNQEQRTKNSLYLDLGQVKNVARVRLNGRDLGVVWTAPWRVEITGALQAGANDLEIEVANLWPNRLIGDATLPADQRRTTTNVQTYDFKPPLPSWLGCKKCKEHNEAGKAELLSSGLLGPVRVMAEK